jgi:hypothetical protein
VQEILSSTHEPRMVSEVVKTLAEQHPDRAASTPVVRNTLEALVAKGLAERERKQGSVFYTAATLPAERTDEGDGPASEVPEEAAEPVAATA